MGMVCARLCSRRRPTPVITRADDGEGWIFIPMVNAYELGDDENQLWEIPSFDDPVSESSSDEEADVSAGRPPQIPVTNFPNLQRGRLVQRGIRSAEATLLDGATERRRNRRRQMHYTGSMRACM